MQYTINLTFRALVKKSDKLLLLLTSPRREEEARVGYTNASGGR
jgi:hypothetical protein